jgi:glutaredoxin
MKLFTYFGALAALCFVSAAHADTVYKIVGPDGKVTYSTTPPTEGQKANVVRMDVAAPEASKNSPPVLTKKEKEVAKEKAAAAEPARSPWQVVKDLFSSSKTETVVKKDKNEKTMEISKSEPVSAATSPGAQISPAAAAAAIVTGGAASTEVTLAFAQPILFVGAQCEACAKAQKFLEKNKITYRTIDVETVDGRRARNEVGNGKSVPLLLSKGARLQGFDQVKYEEHFALR